MKDEKEKKHNKSEEAKEDSSKYLKHFAQEKYLKAGHNTSESFPFTKFAGQIQVPKVSSRPENEWKKQVGEASNDVWREEAKKKVERDLKALEEKKKYNPETDDWE